MKRTKTILAIDDDTRVEITIKVNARPMLTRDEVSSLTEGLASAIMAQLPNVRYLHIPLSKIRVR